MASRLPVFPRFVFTIFEPISLLAGYLPATFFPSWFLAEQIAQQGVLLNNHNARVVTQQLGNCYGLAFLVALAVLYTTSELTVVRRYLVALWLADIGHIAVTCAALGRERVLAVGSWNTMAWGNVGVTAFLFLTRTAYFLRLFGPDKPASAARKLQ